MQRGYLARKLHERRAQILLPSVLLAPIFILVIYLLFETAKVSMTKVRHQFALDNAAYSQVSSASTYLNAMAMVNGPLPFRVMRFYGSEDKKIYYKEQADGQWKHDISIFELFYLSGAVPGALGDKDGRKPNLRPAPASVDWRVHYVEEHPDGNQAQTKQGDPVITSRKDWEKEQPTPPGNTVVRLISQTLVDNYHFPGGKLGIPLLTQYLTTYVYDGSIYKSQDYVFKEVTKNQIMFREAYFLNVSNCKRSECGRESAAKLRPFLSLRTKPFEIEKFEVFFSDGGAKRGDTHGRAISSVLDAPNLLSGQKLFQFAYLDPSSRSKLRSLKRGILLKQKFQLPRNHFNINLEQKYKPYVRTKVSLSCPRNNNNCVWPNPLPKYNVTLDP